MFFLFKREVVFLTVMPMPDSFKVYCVSIEGFLGDECYRVSCSGVNVERKSGEPFYYN